MSEDRKKPGSPEEPKLVFDLDLEENERPTVAPPFDVAEFAREVGTAKSPRIRELADAELEEIDVPDYLSGPPRERQETLTNEVELELARLRSATMATSPPPADLGSSLLSLADARTPSIFPDRPPPNESFVPFDKGWGAESDEEKTEAPPKPMQPQRLPSIRDLHAQVMRGEDDPVESSAQTVRGSSPSFARARAGVVPTNATPKGGIAARAVPGATPVGVARPLALEIDDPLSAEDPLFAAPPTESPRPPQSSTRETPAETPAADDPMLEMRERFSLGDYSGALVIAEGLLEDNADNAEINECADNCRAVLRQMYTARIGPLDRVPVVMVPRDQLRWLSIDHRAGFVLSHIDGVSSLEMILDVSGMPLLDALRILCELSQQRIISFR